MQLADARLDVPLQPDSWDSVCDAMASDETLALSCRSCGSFNFHLVRAFASQPHRVMCAGCLSVVGE